MTPTTATLGILLVGIVVVVGGVLVFRLHAFLALTLGALSVALLTPQASVETYAIKRDGFRVVERSQYESFSVKSDGKAANIVEPPADAVLLRIGNKQWLRAQMECLILPDDENIHAVEQPGVVRVIQTAEARTAGGKIEKIAIAVPTADTAIQPKKGDIAITRTARKLAGDLSRQTIGQRVASGFGRTCANIGIIIAMASIIGKCLLDSGAADRIVRSMLRLLGEKGAPVAFLFSGFLLGIPVFFDTVFYLMIPLGKAMRMRTGGKYLLYVLTIVGGATMAHSLVPPTPGPLLVAEQIGLDVGTMILGGCVVGLFTAGFGFLYASMASRLWELPLRESSDLSLQDLEEIAQRDESQLPPTLLSLLPILLPVVLIGGNTAVKSIFGSTPAVMATLGDKNIALVVSAIVAIGMLVWQKKSSLKDLADSMQAALAGAGVIILITASGGAFGGVLQQTGVADLIGGLSTKSPSVIILLAFLITAAIRTAQGSATVAMITSVGILSGLASSGQLGCHPVYLALAIGCGSKPIGWMNDSGFWVITKMSGMTEVEGLKYVTPMTSLMGVVGLIVVLIGVQLFP